MYFLNVILKHFKQQQREKVHYLKVKRYTYGAQKSALKVEAEKKKKKGNCHAINSFFGSKTHGMPCHVNKFCLFNIFTLAIYIYFKHTKKKENIRCNNKIKKNEKKNKVYNFPSKMLFLPIIYIIDFCQFKKKTRDDGKNCVNRFLIHPTYYI